MAWTTPSTHVAGSLATAAMMNAQVRDNFDWLALNHGVLLALTTDETITTGSATEIPWDAETYDTDGFWTSGTDVTIPTGDYAYCQLITTISWEPNTSGRREVAFLKNAGTGYDGWTEISQDAGAISGSGNARQHLVSPPIVCATGDDFSVRVFHDRGSDLDVDATTDDTSFALTILGMS